ncbi:MAG: aldo/keto reductase [Gemmatimonadales bacterium]|nr:aldo/keto reductase [Gemmatimonadales bacterium]
MDKRRIGTLEVSVVGLGCNNFGMRLDQKASALVIEAALASRITFFDTSDSYGPSEEYLGRTLGSRRKAVVIATKFGKPVPGQGEGATAAYVKLAVEASLRRLRTDYIDLYQLHAPVRSVPITETLDALDKLVRSGKVREIGCSNFSAQQVREATRAARPKAARFVSLQNEYSLLHREPEGAVLGVCQELGIAFLPYFPLASGLLTGKYREGRQAPAGTRIADLDYFKRSATPERFERAEALGRFVGSRGRRLLDLAVSWLALRPAVASVIAGATSAEQVKRNALAASWRLSAEELAEIDAIVPA